MMSGTELSLTRDRARELVDTFARGWSRGQVDSIVSIFSKEAVLVETPFAQPLIGLDAVRRYWSEVPANQSEVTVTTGEVFLAGPWFAAEFKAVFRRRRTGEWVEAKGAFFCETEAGLITEMRMYWHRRP